MNWSQKWPVGPLNRWKSADLRKNPMSEDCSVRVNTFLTCSTLSQHTLSRGIFVQHIVLLIRFHHGIHVNALTRLRMTGRGGWHTDLNLLCYCLCIMTVLGGRIQGRVCQYMVMGCGDLLMVQVGVEQLGVVVFNRLYWLSHNLVFFQVVGMGEGGVERVHVGGLRKDYHIASFPWIWYVVIHQHLCKTKQNPCMSLLYLMFLQNIMSKAFNTIQNIKLNRFSISNFLRVSFPCNKSFFCPKTPFYTKQYLKTSKFSVAFLCNSFSAQNTSIVPQFSEHLKVGQKCYIVYASCHMQFQTGFLLFHFQQIWANKALTKKNKTKKKPPNKQKTPTPPSPLKPIKNTDSYATHLDKYCALYLRSFINVIAIPFFLYFAILIVFKTISFYKAKHYS